MTFGKVPPAELPDHLFRWLEEARGRLSRELSQHLPEDLPELGGRRSRLLQLLPADGLRITDLAALAGVTKQALGQLVTTLERAGLVESLPDPADGRVRLVRRTPRGDRVAADLDRAIHAAQDVLRGEVGAGRFDAMLDTLRALCADPVQQERPTTRP